MTLPFGSFRRLGAKHDGLRNLCLGMRSTRRRFFTLVEMTVYYWVISKASVTYHRLEKSALFLSTLNAQRSTIFYPFVQRALHILIQQQAEGDKQCHKQYWEKNGQWAQAAAVLVNEKHPQVFVDEV